MLISAYVLVTYVNMINIREAKIYCSHFVVNLDYTQCQKEAAVQFWIVSLLRKKCTSFKEDAANFLVNDTV